MLDNTVTRSPNFWDVVECPKCESKDVTIIGLELNIITFRCKACKNRFQKKLSF